MIWITLASFSSGFLIGGITILTMYIKDTQS